MRKLILFAAILSALLFAIPAQAQAYNANRVIATTCNFNNGTNVIYTYLQSSGLNRFTTVPCNGWVPDLNKPWYTVNRPGTDLEGAYRSARYWFPRCEPSNYAQSGPSTQSTGVWYYWYFHVCTA